jgi:hypothetical protein
MNINELITESIKNVITESKGKKDQTSVQFNGPTESSIKDKNVEGKAQTAVDGALAGDIAKENKNPQGEGGKEILKSKPKLAAAVTAGVAHGGIGAKIHPNKNIKFTPPAPATK